MSLKSKLKKALEKSNSIQSKLSSNSSTIKDSQTSTSLAGKPLSTTNAEMPLIRQAPCTNTEMPLLKQVENKQLEKYKLEKSLATSVAAHSLGPKKIQTSKVAKPKKLTSLQEKMQKKLAGSKFRWLNEKLYTCPSQEAISLFQEQPELFDIYHQGFASQVQDWPVNPNDIFIEYLTKKPDLVVADMGCGEAKLAQALHEKLKIYSFDLVAANPFITACDIAHVPLKNASVDIVIFSLALMGTNFLDFINEARRILKQRF